MRALAVLTALIALASCEVPRVTFACDVDADCPAKHDATCAVVGEGESEGDVGEGEGPTT